MSLLVVWTHTYQAPLEVGTIDKLTKSHFPEEMGRTGIAYLECLLGEYYFEGGIQILGVAGHLLELSTCFFKEFTAAQKSLWPQSLISGL